MTDMDILLRQVDRLIDVILGKVPRPVVDSCLNCRFVHAIDPSGRTKPGALECRRHPPFQPEITGIAYFPMTYPDAWCAEGEPRTEEMRVDLVVPEHAPPDADEEGLITTL